MYNNTPPWMWPQTPQQPVMFIPVPGSTGGHPNSLEEYRAVKKQIDEMIKEKEEDEKKAKEKSKPPPKKGVAQLTTVDVFLIMCILSGPIGLGWMALMFSFARMLTSTLH